MRRGRATLALARGMPEEQTQEQGEWSTDAWGTYIVEDEVERLRRFGQTVDESSDSEASDT